MGEIPLSILFAVLILLIILSAFFSGSETALLTLNRYRLQHLVKANHPAAIRAQKLLRRRDRLIGLILLGNNFVNILASSLSTVIAIRMLGDAGIAVAAGILTLVILIFAEVAPKTVAALHPEKLAFPATGILLVLLKVLYPVVWVVNSIANVLLKCIGINPEKEISTLISKEELRIVLSETGSLFPERYKNMLIGILDLESATVEDVMVPRNEIVGIDLHDPIHKVIHDIKTSPHTRLPVYENSIDRVLGIIHVRNILPLVNNKDFNVKAIRKRLVKTYFIPECTPLHRQLFNFKREKLRIGLVVDEYGDMQGLVTLEDLLQEIVGEITTSSLDVQAQKDGSFLVDASVTVRELNRIAGWSLPTEGPKTLNGLIIETLETIPKSGTSLKLADYPVEILEMDGNAVKLARFPPNSNKHSQSK